MVVPQCLFFSPPIDLIGTDGLYNDISKGWLFMDKSLKSGVRIEFVVLKGLFSMVQKRTSFRYF